MATAVTVRVDFSADELRRLAAASKHANQSRRLLSLAAVVDGMSRADAARIGGMDRQTLRDWVHRFNERGPEGLKDSWSKGHPPRLSAPHRHRCSHGTNPPAPWNQLNIERGIANESERKAVGIILAVPKQKGQKRED